MLKFLFDQVSFFNTNSGSKLKNLCCESFLIKSKLNQFISWSVDDMNVWGKANVYLKNFVQILEKLSFGNLINESVNLTVVADVKVRFKVQLLVQKFYFRF